MASENYDFCDAFNGAFSFIELDILLTINFHCIALQVWNDRSKTMADFFLFVLTVLLSGLVSS